MMEKKKRSGEVLLSRGYIKLKNQRDEAVDDLPSLAKDTSERSRTGQDRRLANLCSMFSSTKLFLFSHLFIISALICDSKSIDNGSKSDLRVFLYNRELSYFIYSNESTFHDPKVLWTNHTDMISLEYYPEEKTFFWTTNKGELYSTIWTEDEDMPLEEFSKTDKTILRKRENAKLLYRDEEWYPRSVALDEIGKKLYIADTTERSIDVFDLDGKNKAKIFTDDYVIPLEIVIDPSERLLFLYAFNYHENKTEIHRMNMDGSDHKLIIFESGTPIEFLLDELVVFAIDRVNKQLYYQENARDIVIVDYNGHGRVPIFTGDRIAHVEVHNNRIYWAQRFTFKDILGLVLNQQLPNWNKNKKKDWQLEYIVYSCDISDKTLINSRVLCSPGKINKSLSNTYLNPKNVTYFPEIFKIIDLPPQKKLDDPCLENNGNCEDQCLFKSAAAYKKSSVGCACRVGRRLNDDRKTCSNITRSDKLVDEKEAFVYEKVWIDPTFFYSTKSNYIFQEFVLSSYYPVTKTFTNKLLYDGPEVARDDYFKEKYVVNAEGELVRCQGDNKCTTLRNSTEKIAKFLAYDWVSQNLYYAKSCNYSGKYDLFVLTAKYPEKKIFLGQIDSPTSMAVHPYSGYLFIATYDETKNESHIVRFNTNGKDRIVLPYSNKTTIILTLDMEENVIYWIDGDDGVNDDVDKCLRKSDLDGEDMKILANEKYSEKLKLMIFHHNYIFAKSPPPRDLIYSITRGGQEFYRYDYVENMEQILTRKILTTLKVRKTDTQYLSLENPCVLNNGGCEMFCFAVPLNDSEELRKVCECSADKKLNSNGLNCS